MSLPKSRSFFLYLNIALFIFFLPSLVQAEYWLSDSLYVENNQQFLLNQQTNDTHWQLLPELNFTQILSHSEISLGAKLNLEEDASDGIINNLNIRFAPLSRLVTILGRQKISYKQNDLFRTSLSKNDDKVDGFNYSQGLRIIHRLGYIEQSVFLNQYAHSTASTHYQLKVGIPGYKVGPLVIALEYPSKSNRILRGMLGSALQFPLRIVPGDWQWAFQYATEFNQPQTNQRAWQTSISWLGFIPQHKIGVLFSHNDEAWTYSDDFNPGQDQIDLRYQWDINQQASLEFSLNQIIPQQTSNDKKIETLSFKFAFSF